MTPAALLSLLSLAAQPAADQLSLATLKMFEGAWQTTSKGQPGEGKGERRYEFVLNGKYLQAKNTAVYPPSEQNSKGETHQDWGMFSFDRGRKCLVLRQFHVEGFVNQYAACNAGPSGKLIVFTSEAIENIPPGWRARETYRFLGDDEFTETFELAAPGKEFEIYSETRLRRRR